MLAPLETDRSGQPSYGLACDHAFIDDLCKAAQVSSRSTRAVFE